MSQLTFIDKIQVLFRLLFSSPVIIGIFAFSMILMILLFFYSKLNKKIVKFIFIIIYVALIVFSVVKYGGYFLTSIDSFVTLFMANIYFPTIPVYVLILLISFIIMIVTLSSKKKTKFIKVVNTVFFTLIQMLFALFIYIVEFNNIDVSTNTNLYTNEQTLTLLEFGMGLFVVWIVILLIVFYLKKADKIFKVNKNETVDDFDEYINDFNEPVKVVNKVDVRSKKKERVKKEKIKKIKNKNKGNDEVISKNLNNSVNGFNNNVVQSLVPEVGLFDSQEEEVVLLDDFDSVSHNIIDMNSNTSDNFTNKVTNDNINNVNLYSKQVSYNTNKVDSIDNEQFNQKSNSSFDVFSNFEFLDVPNKPVDRKNNDVEVIDFDS